jgi:hypothetical protein
MSRDQQEIRRRLRGLRVASFLAFLAFMLFGPVWTQVLGHETRLVRKWAMFHPAGIGVVDATFVRRMPDGSQEVVDRFAVLGHTKPRTQAKHLWRIEGQRQTWEVAQSLCKAFGAEADVRVIAREAIYDGWKELYRGKANLCSAPPPEQEKPPGVGESP